MYTTYILYSESIENYYIGFTSDTVEIRLSKHLADHNGFTSRAKDWVVMYKQQFETKVEAMLLEKKLKSWKNKIRLRQFIERSTE